MSMARTRGSGRIYRQKHSSNWWLQWYAGGVRHQESSGTAEYNEAEKALQRKIAESVVFGAPAPASLTVANLVEAKLKNEVDEGFKDLKSSRQRWENHLKAELGNTRVRDLTAKRMREYRQKRQKEGAPPSTVNRELSVVRAAYKLAWKDDVIRLNDIPHFPMVSEKNRRRKGFLSPEQYQAVFDACMRVGLWLAAAMQTAHDFGWRRGEVFPMQVSQVDLGSNTMYLPDSKNGEGRLMVMTDKVRELVAQCVKGKKPTDYVFTRDGNRPVKSLYKSWREAMREAQVPTLHFQDLRRTATRNLVRAGVPKSVAQQVTGHLDPKVFDRYDISDLADLQDAKKKLDKSAIPAAIQN